ncbi:MAG: copper resistance system multicopper oxidase [Cocleimonas sp.]
MNNEKINGFDSNRRRFVQGLSSGGVLASLGLMSNNVLAAKQSTHEVAILDGPVFDLTIEEVMVNFTGKTRVATAINGSIPAPTLRMREGDDIVLRVTNKMAVTSSIHWHGLILPNNMDGVPGLSFDGIAPGETYVYKFKAVQNGTYWYHSHSGFQEQTGMYGSIVIEPRNNVARFDRDYVVLLSDWTDEKPENVYAKLKKMSHYYNTRERTLSDFTKEVKQMGLGNAKKSRDMWNQMRMSDRDISDVTGMTYTFLTNGKTPNEGWTGSFKAGERVRLRFINAAAMTFFDVRIPGVKMEVIATDGQYIKPVLGIDEFRIGVAETYDVIVQPTHGSHAIFAQTIDRSGYAFGTLTSNGQKAKAPAMDIAPILTHTDMGMDMGGMDMSDPAMAGMDHSAMGHDMGSMEAVKPRVQVAQGVQTDMMATAPQTRLNDPGVGLRNNGRRVLTYADLRNYYPTIDKRSPNREIELHLTGNMSRYMWSINGVKFQDAKPIGLKFGERVRFTLINDTMMNHPIHLHGMWSELESGDDNYLPRKHTIVNQPGAKVSYLVTADAKGQWAFHCHLIYHMKSMFRRVIVS